MLNENDLKEIVDRSVVPNAMSESGIYALFDGLWKRVTIPQLDQLETGVEVKIHYHPTDTDHLFLRIKKAREFTEPFEIIRGRRLACMTETREIGPIDGHNDGKNHVGFDQLVILGDATASRGRTGREIGLHVPKKATATTPLWLKREAPKHNKKK